MLRSVLATSRPQTERNVVSIRCRPPAQEGEFGAVHAAVFTGNAHVLREILRRHPALAHVSSEGGGAPRTPLHFAAISTAGPGACECAELLIEHGADINDVRDADKHSPLITAVLQQNEPIVRVLLQRGARIDVRVGHPWSDGSTALHLAASLGLARCVRTLLEYRADCSATDAVRLRCWHDSAAASCPFSVAFLFLLSQFSLTFDTSAPA